MTESSVDKTKRNYKNYINSADWCCQITIFCQDDDPKEVLGDFAKFKRSLTRSYELPFLWRICLLRDRTDRIIRPYLTAYTAEWVSKSDDNLTKAIGNLDGDYVISTRKRSRKQMLRTLGTLCRTAPHNLNAYFGETVKRISLSNKEYLPTDYSPEEVIEAC